MKMTTRLLALAAIGTGIALLFTTKKGKELRSDIADRSGDLWKKLGDLTNSVKENGAALGKRVKEHA